MKNSKNLNFLYLNSQINTENDNYIEQIWQDYPYKFDYILYQICNQHNQNNNQISDIIIDFSTQDPTWIIELQGINHYLILNHLSLSQHDIEIAKKNVLNSSYTTPILTINGHIRAEAGLTNIALRFLPKIFVNHSNHLTLSPARFITFNDSSLSLIKLHKNLNETLIDKNIDLQKLKL